MKVTKINTKILKDIYNAGIGSKEKKLKGKKKGKNDLANAIKYMYRLTFAALVAYLTSIIYICGIITFNVLIFTWIAIPIIFITAFFCSKYYFYIVNPLLDLSYATYLKYVTANIKKGIFGFYYYSKNMKIYFFRKGLLSLVIDYYNCSYDEGVKKVKEILNALDKKTKDEYYEKYFTAIIVIIAHTMVRGFLGVSFYMLLFVTLLESSIARELIIHKELIGVLGVIFILFLVLYIRNKNYEDHLESYFKICEKIINIKEVEQIEAS